MSECHETIADKGGGCDGEGAALHLRVGTFLLICDSCCWMLFIWSNEIRFTYTSHDSHRMMGSQFVEDETTQHAHKPLYEVLSEIGQLVSIQIFLLLFLTIHGFYVSSPTRQCLLPPSLMHYVNVYIARLALRGSRKRDRGLQLSRSWAVAW